MTYCCTAFQNLLACAGERGTAVLVGFDSSGELWFHLQSRGIAFEDEPKLKPTDIDITINIHAEMGLRYCPSCGRLLEKLLKQHKDFYAKLAKEHEKYLVGWVAKF